MGSFSEGKIDPSNDTFLSFRSHCLLHLLSKSNPEKRYSTGRTKCHLNLTFLTISFDLK